MIKPIAIGAWLIVLIVVLSWMKDTVERRRAYERIDASAEARP